MGKVSSVGFYVLFKVDRCPGVSGLVMAGCWPRGLDVSFRSWNEFPAVGGDWPAQPAAGEKNLRRLPATITSISGYGLSTWG